MKANRRKIMKAIAVSKIILDTEVDVSLLRVRGASMAAMMTRYGVAASEIGVARTMPASVFSAKRPRVDPRRHRRWERKQVIIRTWVKSNTSTDETVRLINEGIKNDQRGE